jgi:tungstate transport system substrate-binding protein
MHSFIQILCRAGLPALFALSQVVTAAELRLGATTTLQDSGVLAVLVPAFEARCGIRVRTVIAATGQVMRSAQNGEVDVVFTHSRPDEEKLIASGTGKARSDVMWNDFVIAGPAADPAHIRGMHDAVEALKRIRDAGAGFVSRGDDSGTHTKERQLWAESGGLTAWPKYVSSGQGAGLTVMKAHGLDAYDLVDRPTLKRLAKRYPLAILVTTLRPSGRGTLNERDAEAFAAWIVSAEARRLISAYRIQGDRAFYLPGEER